MVECPRIRVQQLVDTLILVLSYSKYDLDFLCAAFDILILE